MENLIVMVTLNVGCRLFMKLNELFSFINSLHPTIKFTMDYSTTEIKFLGVTVTKVANKLETDLYCKPNDTHQFFHPQSCTLQCHRNVC